MAGIPPLEFPGLSSASVDDGGHGHDSRSVGPTTPVSTDYGAGYDSTRRRGISTDSAATPVIPGNLEWRTPAQRAKRAAGLLPPSGTSATTGDIDARDTLRRVAVVIYQHILRGEYESGQAIDAPAGAVSSWRSVGQPKMGLAKAPPAPTTSSAVSAGGYEDKDLAGPPGAMAESRFLLPQWRIRYARPALGMGLWFGITPKRPRHKLPSVADIFAFAWNLHTKAALTPEVCIVCLVYIERAMELGGLKLRAWNWRPMLLCGMLLASKVWQDLATWNIEFAEVYPQFGQEGVNAMESTFVNAMKFDLYIASSVYAKYNFALRALTEQSNFRKRYIRVCAVGARGKTGAAARVEKSSQELRAALYSRSM